MFSYSDAAPGSSEPSVSLHSSPAKPSFPTHGRAHSYTTHLPSSARETVQTQQPCSLKGSLSSDNIYAGDDSRRQGSSGLGDYQGHS